MKRVESSVGIDAHVGEEAAGEVYAGTCVGKTVKDGKIERTEQRFYRRARIRTVRLRMGADEFAGLEELVRLHKEAAEAQGYGDGNITFSSTIRWALDDALANMRRNRLDDACP